MLEYREGMTIGEAVRVAGDYLSEHGVDNANQDSFELLSDVMGMTRTQYYMKSGDIIPKDSFDAFCENVDRRANREPLQHILGKAYFYGEKYMVNKDVLIPRPETELLIDCVKNNVEDCENVLDMCTGSGCIILTLIKLGVFNSGLGVDLSDKALEVARINQNSILEEIKSKVNFIQSDLFTNVDDSVKYDVIVSNPPYIRSDVIDTLQTEVKDYDPLMALDGFEDGLHFYREITSASVKYLKNDGWLFYEIGHDQADEVSDMMVKAGFKGVTVVKDYSGFDRIVYGQL